MAESFRVSARCCSNHSLPQLCLISSSFLTAIAFKQDELCFHVLFCCQKSSESSKTVIMSCKNCHNFVTKRFQKNPVFYFIISSLLVVRSKFQCFQLTSNIGNTHTHAHTANLITVTLRSAYAGKGYNNSNFCSQSLAGNTDYNYII